MKISDFQLTYYPIGKECPKGFSSWHLGRIDRENWNFPSHPELKKIFREIKPRGEELQVERRYSNCLILLLPVRVSKTVRQRFLTVVASCPEAPAA